MPSVLFSNNASGSLASSITSSGTTITLTTGGGAQFPAISGGNYFYATLTDSSNNLEIVKVTARASDVLTVVRAQEGTTGRAYAAADKLELRVTAAVMNSLPQLAADQTFSGANTFSGATSLANATLASPTMSAPTITGVSVAPTASFGTNTTQLATTAFVQAALQALHPIGSIYTNVTSTNPGTLFGFGTWTAFGAGRVMVGFDSGNTLFDTAEETGGSYNATLVSHTHTATTTITDPGHNHQYKTYGLGNNGLVGNAYTNYDWGYAQTDTKTTGITAATTNSTEGSAATNANIQPYITVYMWKRTA